MEAREGRTGPYFIHSKGPEIHFANVFRGKMPRRGKMMEESCENLFP